jgi:hypothetical protein
VRSDISTEITPPISRSHELWTQLFAQHRIVHHPVFPGREGPAARRIESQEDVDDVIVLLRLNYDRLTAPRREASPSAS